MSEENYNALKRSIQEFGFLVPIVVNRNYVIADGHHKFLAAQQLGMKEVPVAQLDIDEIDRKILRQVLNKLHGEHDADKDKAEYQWLLENDGVERLLQLLPDNADDIKRALENNVLTDMIESDDNKIDENNIKTDIKIGSRIALGQHTLFCDDATTFSLPAPVDLIFTDPPFDLELSSIEFFKFCNKHVFVMTGDKQVAFLIHKYFEKFHSFFVVHHDMSVMYPSFKVPLKHHNMISHFKGDNADSPEVKGLRTVIHITTMYDKEQKELSISKVLEIPSTFISYFSKENNIILDLFAGTGSTLIACEKLNRSCVAVELSPTLCEVICRRWENLTGQKRIVVL